MFLPVFVHPYLPYIDPESGVKHQNPNPLASILDFDLL
jgi:hypothetical protein